jgi:ribose 5-phosphate isomerase A
VSERERQKRAAAERAVEFVASGMRLGLGTGSTAKHVLDVLGEQLRSGKLRDIAGVPTSRATAEYAQQVGIPMLELHQAPELDLAIDGADEVDPRLDLIKGLGGALLWEKIVETAAARFVVVVDDSKRVDRLGEKAPVPIEVVTFGWQALLPFLRSLGGDPRLRERDGTPFVTDERHYIIDLHFDGGVKDAAGVEAALRARPGIVETGLFLGMADVAVIASEGGIQVQERQAS